MTRPRKQAREIGFHEFQDSLVQREEFLGKRSKIVKTAIDLWYKYDCT